MTKKHLFLLSVLSTVQLRVKTHDNESGRMQKPHVYKVKVKNKEWPPLEQAVRCEVVTVLSWEEEFSNRTGQIKPAFYQSLDLWELMVGLQQRNTYRTITLIPCLENQILPYFYIWNLQLLALYPKFLLLLLHASVPATTWQLFPIPSSVTGGYERSCTEYMHTEQSTRLDRSYTTECCDLSASFCCPCYSHFMGVLSKDFSGEDTGIKLHLYFWLTAKHLSNSQSVSSLPHLLW